MAGGWSREDLDTLPSDVALEVHLTSRCYPPRMIMFDVAKQAIAKAREGLWSKLLTLPNGVSHAGHGKKVPVFAVVQHLHLDDLL